MSALRPRPQPFEKLRICKAEYRRLRRTKIPATDFRSWHFSDLAPKPCDVRCPCTSGHRRDREAVDSSDQKFGYTENLSDFDRTDRLKSLAKFVGD
jgi:hypothetical protein